MARWPRPGSGRRAPADATGRWQRQLHASRRWALWGAAAGVLAGTVLAAPASWLADGLASASGQRLLLADARGSLWNGSAVLVLTGGAGSRDAATLPGRLGWTLRPSGLGLQLQAEHACCLNGPLTLVFAPRWGGYSLAVLPTPPSPNSPAPTLGQWPANWLSGLGAPFNTLALGGLVQASSPGLRLQSTAGRLQVAGTLQLDLLDLSSRVSPLPVLGSYRLSLRGQPLPPDGAGGPSAAAGADTATVQLNTLGGALLLSGDGQWTAGKLRFRGQAQAGGGQETVLGNLLNIIGRRQGALSLISIG